MEAYSYYSLIGDKLTTPAFNTVGVDAASPHVPKHVHDMASLLKPGLQPSANRPS